MIPLSAIGRAAGRPCRGTTLFVTSAKGTCTTRVSDCTNPPPLGKNPHNSVSGLLCCMLAHHLIFVLFSALYRLALVCFGQPLLSTLVSLAFLHPMYDDAVHYHVRVHLSWLFREP